MKKIYNLVLIGCGHMGAAHLDDIYYREYINLVGVVDQNLAQAQLFSKKYNSSSYSVDYHEYLENPDIDIIIIATYPSSHLEILRDCLKAGKHVLCEKPITDSIESGKEFVDLVKNSPSKVLVGHILRHNESYKKIAELIHEDAIGHPIIMRMVQNHHTIDWKKYLKLINETSPIIDCGVHYIDVMRWFTKAELIYLTGITQRTEIDVPETEYNYGMLTAKLSDGSIAYYEAGWGNTFSASNIKEFIGPKGRLTLIQQKDRWANKEEGDLIEYYKYPEKTYEAINIKCKRKPTGKQLCHLIDMIEKDIPAIPSIDDVYTSFYEVAMADKAIKKMKSISRL